GLVRGVDAGQPAPAAGVLLALRRNGGRGRARAAVPGAGARLRAAPPVRDRARPVRRLPRRVRRRGAMTVPALLPGIEAGDIQGNVLHGYGRALPCARYVPVRIPHADAGRSLLAKLRVT